MNIKTKVVAVLALAVFVLPGVTFAQAATTAQLQSEIANLTAQLNALEATAEAISTPPTPVPVNGSTLKNPLIIITEDSVSPSVQEEMGDSDDLLGGYDFNNPSSEGVNVITLTVIDTTTSSKPSFANLTLWSSPTATGVLLGTASAPVANAHGYSYTFNFYTPISIPQGQKLTLALRGNALSYQSGGATDGSTHIFGIAAVSAIGSTSGQIAIANFLVAHGGLLTVVRTVLEANATPSGGTVHVPSTADTLGTITLFAGTFGGLEPGKMTVTFSEKAGTPSAALLDSATLVNNITGQNLVTLKEATQSINVAAHTVTWNFNGVAIPAAGQMSLRLVVNSTLDTLPSGGALTATIQSSGDLTYTDATDGTGVSGLTSSYIGFPVVINNVSYAPTTTATTTPVITSITGSPWTANTIVTISGTNFTSSSQIEFDSGGPQPPLLIFRPSSISSDGTQIQFTIPFYDVDILGPGTYEVSVINNLKYKSNEISFILVAPVPTVTSISPSTVSQSTTVTISGTGFADLWGTTVEVDNSSGKEVAGMVPTYVSEDGTSLRFSTGGAFLGMVGAGTYQVGVVNPGPTQMSNTKPFVVSASSSTTGGVLTGAISAGTPQSTYVGMGTTGVVLAQYQFTADASRNENVTQVNITDSSSGSTVTPSTDQASFINYRLVDTSGNVLGAAVENGSGVLQFNLANLNVPANAAEVVNLKADVNAYPYATSGATHAYALTSFDYTNTAAAKTVNLMTNNIGDLFTVYQTTLVVTVSPFANPSSISGVGTIVGAFNFIAGSGSINPVVKTVTLSTNGSAIQSNTVQTFGLYDSANPFVVLATGTVTGANNVTFNLRAINPNQWALPSNSTKTLFIKMYAAPTNLVTLASGFTGSYQIDLAGVTWTDGKTVTIPSLSPNIAMPVGGQNITGLSNAATTAKASNGTAIVGQTLQNLLNQLGALLKSL